jgi:predicted NAD/FAD-binding protein
VFEACKRLGGHTATMDVQLGTRRFAIDTGFIVFNDWTYPNFIALMDEFGISSKPTTRWVSACATNTAALSTPAAISTCCSRSVGIWWRRASCAWCRDILRFNRESVADLEAGSLSATT